MSSRSIIVSILFGGMAQTAVGATVNVAASGTSFVPPNVTITAGDSVHWTGLLSGFHTVAEVDDALDVTWNGGFHSPAAADEYTFVFNTPGGYFYICEPHVGMGMRGTVTVEAGPVPTVSQWGLVVLALLIVGAATVMIVQRRVGPASN